MTVLDGPQNIPFILVNLGNPGFCPVCESRAKKMWHWNNRVICCEECSYLDTPEKPDILRGG